MTNDCCNIWPVSGDSPAVEMSARYRWLINLNVLITKVSSIIGRQGRQSITVLPFDHRVYDFKVHSDRFVELIDNTMPALYVY